MKTETISYPLKHKESILLIDDDELIIDLFYMILDQLGYKVTANTCPEHALNEFRKNPYQVDLIITDYTMPRMNGAELCRQILRIRPDVPIILCTGDHRINEKIARALGFQRLASKPLSESLGALVRSVLKESKCGTKRLSQNSQNLESLRNHKRAQTN